MSRLAPLHLFAALTALVAMAPAARAQRAGPGSSGPPTPAQQPPVLTALSINGGADTIPATDLSVTLVHTVVGARPSEYRVSHRADFAGASWLPYTAVPALRDWYDSAGEPCDASKTTRRTTLYFQVRAALGEEVRIVDGQRQIAPARVESNVLRASVCARVPRTPPR
jgi:hypothetical protein